MFEIEIDVPLCICISGSLLKDSFGVCFNAFKGGPGVSWDNARKTGRFTEQMVDGVIAVCRVLPIFILVIVYWAVYSQVK